MLFNSPIFLFYFLPVVVLVALTLRTRAHTLMPFLCFVCLASLAFYSYTNPAWLLLIIGSIVGNYALGVWLRSHTARRQKLALGICLNLSLLGFFKYADFLIVNANAFLGLDQQTLGILLPIGISFYTFQQIAFLVDVYHDPSYRCRFVDYLFFVSFFPQLIAGPIVHHKQLIPQLANLRERRLETDLAAGLTLFLMGLTKKLLLADTFGQYASAYFDSPTASPAEAWIGVSAYSLQIYFDFSGYSDMALGLGRMFGLKLPINFDSPYKAHSIIDFWRRWHITLSQFLKNYLYIPLGGNRAGSTRRYLNLLITMLLGGLWHGAGWGFIVWGGLHGLYLCCNHGLNRLAMPRWLRTLGWPLTLTAVVIAWVPFRADSLETTISIWQTMFWLSTNASTMTTDTIAVAYLMVGLVLVRLAPNSQQILEHLFSGFVEEQKRHPLLQGHMPSYVRPTIAGIMGFAAALGLALNNRISEFLYFQF